MVSFLIHLLQPYFLQITHYLNIMESLILCIVVVLPSSIINLSIIHPFQCPFIQYLNVLVLLFHYPPFQLKFLQFINLDHYRSLLSALSLSFLEHHITSNVDLSFVGDFNIHIDKQNDRILFFLTDLLIEISFPTHDSVHILDLIVKMLHPSLPSILI